MKLTRAFSLLLASAWVLVPWGANADQPSVDPRTACATDFFVTTVDRDPNAVVVRTHDSAGPLSGTITAYGHDKMWTGTIGQSASVAMRDGRRENSLVVRAEAPIEGIEYAPSWASCTFRAGVRTRNGYDGPDLERPVLTVSNQQPAEPAECAHPYVSPAVQHAVEPQGVGVGGDVRVAVALDERGVPQAARVVSSPASVLNLPSLDAARRSRFTGAVFRCKPVSGGYEFAVQYP